MANTTQTTAKNVVTHTKVMLFLHH